MTIVDLTKGPMVVEVPPKSLGSFDDMWFRWIIYAGAPGPDRGDRKNGSLATVLPRSRRMNFPSTGKFWYAQMNKSLPCMADSEE
jgi:hypothetical protein